MPCGRGKRARRVSQLIAEEQRELGHLLRSEAPDRERIQALIESSGRRAIELDLAFADNVFVVRELLDGPQEERFVRMLAKMYNRYRVLGEPGRRGKRSE